MAGGSPHNLAMCSISLQHMLWLLWAKEVFSVMTSDKLHSTLDSSLASLSIGQLVEHCLQTLWPLKWTGCNKWVTGQKCRKYVEWPPGMILLCNASFCCKETTLCLIRLVPYKRWFISWVAHSNKAKLYFANWLHLFHFTLVLYYEYFNSIFISVLTLSTKWPFLTPLDFDHESMQKTLMAPGVTTAN